MLNLKGNIPYVLCIYFFAIPCIANAKTLKVSSSEYGDKWSFTVAEGVLECTLNAVIMHTSKGTYSINGNAMERYKNKYPTWRAIAKPYKPYPGFNDPKATIPPPEGFIQRGLDLCQ